MSQKIDHVVAAIEESKDLSKLTLHELMGHLRHMNMFSSQPLEQAFQSKVNLGEKKFQSRTRKRKGPFQKKEKYEKGHLYQNEGRGKEEENLK